MPVLKAILGWVRNMGAFSFGLFVGTCYGAVVASVTSFLMLSAIL